MKTLQEEIAQKFLTKLTSSDAVDSSKIEQLRMLLADGKKKPKADDFIRVFSAPKGGDLK